MSHAVVIAYPVTVAAFDAFVDAEPEDTKWEPVNGQILAMSNPTTGHGPDCPEPWISLKDRR